MKVYGNFNMTGGAEIIEIVVDSGTSDPGSAVPGELFYRSDLQELRFYNGSVWVATGTGAPGTVTSIAATGSTGLTVGGSPITTTGTLTFTLGTELQGLSALSANGFVERTGSGTYTTTTVVQSFSAGTGISTTGSSGSITVANTGVLTFNTRAGAVTLTSGDVTTALGFTPASNSIGGFSDVIYNSGGSLTGNAGFQYDGTSSVTIGSSSASSGTINTASSTGTINITASDISGGNGGEINISAGTSISSGNGGYVTLQGGLGTGSSLGGGVALLGANSGGTGGATAGSIEIYAGNGTGAAGALGGNILINSGTSVSGAPGWIYISAPGGIKLNNILGSVGQYLSSNGAGQPTWVSLPSTGVTSVAATGSTGLVVGGSPITSTGTLTFTLGNELQALNGLSTTGFVQRTGAATYSVANLTSGQITTALGFTPGTGNGTVTTVSVATANGVSGSVATATTTPAITLTLGAITPSSVNASGTVLGSNISGSTSGTNTGDQTITLTGDVTGSGTGSFATALASVGTPVTASFVKITTDVKGRVTATTAVTSSDITTSLGYTPINKAGDSVSGTLTFSSGTVTGLAAPTNASDAATKNYVDSVAAGLTPKQAVIAGSTVNLSATAAGSGVGKTLTNSGTQVAFALDGVSLSSGQRVLIKNQTTAANNGIYSVTTVGSGSTNWVLTRTTDFDGSPANEVASGDTTFIETGTTQATTFWVLTTADPITVDTSGLSFTQYGGPGSYSAGTGLTLTGTVFSLPSVGTSGTYTSVTTDGQGRVTAGTNPGYITGNQSITLSGDISGTGTTAITGTLETVNANVGTFNYSTITVNGKGLVTAASSNTPVTTLTGTASQVTVSASTGAVTLSLPGTINVNTSGTAAIATNTIITDNAGVSSATWYPTFVSAGSGNLPSTVDATVNPLTYVPSTGTLGTSNVTITGNVSHTGGQSTAYWLSSDGTGRQHWYWNTAGGNSPTYLVGNEDAMDIMMTSNTGQGWVGNATFATTVMTVTATTSGTLAVGNLVGGTGVAASTYVVSLGTYNGTSGTGTVNVNTTNTIGAAVTVTGYSTNATFNATISATTLTISSLHSGTVQAGLFIGGTGVSAGTYIISGSGLVWTINNSQTVASSTVMAAVGGPSFNMRAAGGANQIAGTALSFTNLLTLNSTGSSIITASLTVSGSIVATTFTGSGSGLTGVVSSITGTANQIAASASTGAVTLSLPNNVIISAPPSGAALTVTGPSGNWAGVFNAAATSGGIGLSVVGNFTGAGSTSLLAITDANNTNGANIQITGNGATTPNKYIRVQAGTLQFLNSAYTAQIMTLSDAGALSITTTSGNIAAFNSSGQNAVVQVAAPSTFSSNFYVMGNGNASTAGLILQQDTSSNAYIRNLGSGSLNLGTGATNYISISSAGNVVLSAPTSGIPLVVNNSGVVSTSGPTMSLVQNATTLAFIPSDAAGGFNAIVGAGDSVIIGQGTAINTGVLTLTAWSATTVGIKIAAAGTVGITGTTTITGTLTVTSTIGASNFSGSHSGTSSGTNTGDQTITLTGDATGSGTGSFATTLATVNGNVGSFTNASITVNAKGLITAASSGAATVTSITGTANQITASASTGAVTVSVPANNITTGTRDATINSNSGTAYTTGTITVDFSTGNVQRILLGASGLTINFTNIPTTQGQAQTMTLILVQDGTGSRTLPTFSQTINWDNGLTPVLSTGANMADIFQIVAMAVRSTTTVYAGGQVLGNVQAFVSGTFPNGI